ncbi:MAG: hypothetical protein ACRENU_06200 [Gemmatimonadaceae bacterium]
MQLGIRAFAIATGGAGMLAYAVGALLDSASSWGGAAAVSFIFRVDVVELARPLTPASLSVGLMACGLFGALLGGFVAWAYNRLSHAADTRPTAAVSQP